MSVNTVTSINHNWEVFDRDTSIDQPVPLHQLKFDINMNDADHATVIILFVNNGLNENVANIVPMLQDDIVKYMQNNEDKHDYFWRRKVHQYLVDTGNIDNCHSICVSKECNGVTQIMS